MTDIHKIRRNNLLAEYWRYCSEAIPAGCTHKGLEQAFAKFIDTSAVQFSGQKSGARAIGDRLARRIEVGLEKYQGWLDEEHESESMTPDECSQVGLMLHAYRHASTDGRLRLRQWLTAAAIGPPKGE